MALKNLSNLTLKTQFLPTSWKQNYRDFQQIWEGSLLTPLESINILDTVFKFALTNVGNLAACELQKMRNPIQIKNTIYPSPVAVAL